MSLIKVENLSTSFDNNIIHENISFDIKKNEIFGILGGSGSGKTTLVRQMVLLQKIQKGKINIFHKNISTLNLKQTQEFKQEFSFLFQFGALFSFLNVLDNISVTLKEYTNLPSDLIKKVAFTKLKMVGLPTHCATLFPSELSGGMKKRVALARAISMDPKILFLDEPTSGLDPASTKSLNILIKDLRDMLDLTVVIITHDLGTITDTLDKFILLDNKKILFNGTFKEALKNNNKRIQNFFNTSKV